MHDIDCDDDEDCECETTEDDIICPGCKKLNTLFYGMYLSQCNVFKPVVRCWECGWSTDPMFSVMFMYLS